MLHNPQAHLRGCRFPIRHFPSRCSYALVHRPIGWPERRCRKYLPKLHPRFRGCDAFSDPPRSWLVRRNLHRAASPYGRRARSKPCRHTHAAQSHPLAPDAAGPMDDSPGGNEHPRQNPNWRPPHPEGFDTATLRNSTITNEVGLMSEPCAEHRADAGGHAHCECAPKGNAYSGFDQAGSARFGADSAQHDKKCQRSDGHR
jgi:hypothetical protein